MENKTNEEVVLNDAERQKCEVWTRVMGYHRPTENFNIGKKGECEERVYFQEFVASDHIKEQ
jgi:anaerobic ribonucleoside-triphosphate reductase